MTSLHFWLLGPWQAYLNGEPLPALPTRHARALLARLALTHPQSLARAQLVVDLFPDATPEKGAGSLRTTVYYVRRVMGNYLHAEHDEIGLDPALRVVHDVGEFERMTVAEAPPAVLRQAVELYRGPFLESLFEGWSTAEALRLHAIYLNTLRRLVVLAEAQGELATVVDVAQRWAREEPWEYAAHRALVLALLARGDRVASERAIDVARTQLQTRNTRRTDLDFHSWARAAARLPATNLSMKPADSPLRGGIPNDDLPSAVEPLLDGVSARERSDVLADALSAGEQALEESCLAVVARALAMAEQMLDELALDPHDSRRWMVLLLRAGYHATVGPRAAWLEDLAAMDAFAMSSSRPEWRLETMVRRAHALRVQGQLQSAEQTAREAIALARMLGSQYEEGRASRILAFVLDQQMRLTAEVLEAWQAVAAATADVPSDPMHLEAQLNIAKALVRLGQSRPAKVLIDGLLATPALDQHPRLRALAPRYLGLVAYALRDYEAALVAMRESVRWLAQIGAQGAEIASRRSLMDMLAGLGQFEEARALGGVNIMQARQLGMHFIVWEELCTLATIELWTGNGAAALRLGMESFGLVEAHGTIGNAVKILGIIAQSAAMAGKLTEAGAALHRVQQLAGDVDPAVMLRAMPVDILHLLGERELAVRLARDILHAPDIVLGMPIEHSPVHGLRSFWNAAAVLAAVEGRAAARPFQEQAYFRFVDDLSRLQSHTARRAFLNATPPNRELSGFRSNGPRRLVLLPLETAPTGRSLHPDERGTVVWTIDVPGDPPSGVTRRRRQLQRLVHEAREQGAVATVEALAEVLNVGTRTIQRDLQALRREGAIN